MHFHCTQCRHQFCSGCYNAFYAKNVSSGRGGRREEWVAVLGLRGGGPGKRNGQQDRKPFSVLFPLRLLQTP